MDYHLIVFILVALYWVGVGIFRFFKWIGRSLANVNTIAPSPIQQAMAEAQRQAEQVPKPPAPRPQPVQPRIPPPSARPFQMFQQPGAGGPAVPWESTEQDFRRQEQELLTEEPTALNIALQSTPPQDAPAPLRLFETNDDLIRAFILQEALGPPLSKRPR